MCACLYKFMYVWQYVCMYVCMYACMYLYIYTYSRRHADVTPTPRRRHAHADATPTLTPRRRRRHADATPTRGRARSATRPRRGGAVPPGPGAGGAVSPERDRIGAGAAASDAGPRPPAQRPPPVPRDAIVRSSMGSLVDRACSGYTKTKKLNEAGERSAPVRVGELPGASPRGAGSPGRSARRVGLGF